MLHFKVFSPSLSVLYYFIFLIHKTLQWFQKFKVYKKLYSEKCHSAPSPTTTFTPFSPTFSRKSFSFISDLFFLYFFYQNKSKNHIYIYFIFFLTYIPCTLLFLLRNISSKSLYQFVEIFLILFYSYVYSVVLMYHGLFNHFST